MKRFVRSLFPKLHVLFYLHGVCVCFYSVGMVMILLNVHEFGFVTACLNYFCKVRSVRNKEYIKEMK